MMEVKGLGPSLNINNLSLRGFAKDRPQLFYKSSNPNVVVSVLMICLPLLSLCIVKAVALLGLGAHVLLSGSVA